MGRIEESMRSPTLGLRETKPSDVRVSDDYIQTIALIVGMCTSGRVALRASPTGIGFNAGAPLVDVEHWTATAPNDTINGDNIQCTEILCVAHPDNAGRIWVRTKEAATTANAIPLDAGDIVGFTVDNLKDVHSLIVASGDSLIVGYSQ